MHNLQMKASQEQTVQLLLSENTLVVILVLWQIDANEKVIDPGTKYKSWATKKVCQF